MSEVARTRVIGVASAKGSPGVTFLAAGLACRLASSGLDVVAVDADAEDRTLAATLDVDAGDTAGALVRTAALGVVTAEGFRALAPTVARHLALVEAPPVDALDGRALVAAARGAGFAASVLDLGHLGGRLQRQLAAACDWLLWVVMPDRLGLERADQVIRRGDLTPASAALVFNRQGRGAVAGADRVLAERLELPVMARIREDAGAARRVSARRPPHSFRAFRSGFEEVARAVHPDVTGTSRSVWP